MRGLDGKTGIVQGFAEPEAACSRSRLHAGAFG